MFQYEAVFTREWTFGRTKVIHQYERRFSLGFCVLHLLLSLASFAFPASVERSFFDILQLWVWSLQPSFPFLSSASSIASVSFDLDLLSLFRFNCFVNRYLSGLDAQEARHRRKEEVMAQEEEVRSFSLSLSLSLSLSTSLPF